MKIKLSLKTFAFPTKVSTHIYIQTCYANTDSCQPIRGKSVAKSDGK